MNSFEGVLLNVLFNLQKSWNFILRLFILWRHLRSINHRQLLFFKWLNLLINFNVKNFNLFRFILKIQLEFYFQTFFHIFSQSSWVNIIWFSRWIDTKTRLWKLNVNKIFYGSLSWDCMLPCCLELFTLCLFDYPKIFCAVAWQCFFGQNNYWCLNYKLTIINYNPEQHRVLHHWYPKSWCGGSIELVCCCFYPLAWIYVGETG